MLESVKINLNVEQAHEIRLALKDRIERLKKLQERCRELETVTENPLLKHEYKKVGKTYDTWIKDVEAVLEHIECETGEIRP